MSIGQNPLRRGLLAATSTLAVARSSPASASRAPRRTHDLRLRAQVGEPCFTLDRRQADVRARRAADRDDPDRRHGHVGLHRLRQRQHHNAADERRRRRTPPGSELRQTTSALAARTRGRSTRRAPTSSSARPHAEHGRARSPSRASPSSRADADADGDATTTPTPTATRRRRRRRPRPRHRDARRPHVDPRARARGRAKDTEAPRLQSASVKRVARRRAGALLALRAGDGADHACAQGLEDVLRRATRAGARGHALARPAHASASRRAPTRSRRAPPTRWATRAPAVTKTLKVK